MLFADRTPLSICGERTERALLRATLGAMDTPDLLAYQEGTFMRSRPCERAGCRDLYDECPHEDPDVAWRGWIVDYALSGRDDLPVAAGPVHPGYW